MSTKQQANKEMLRRVEVSALVTRIEMLRDEYYRDGERDKWTFLASQAKNMRSFLKTLQPKTRHTP